MIYMLFDNPADKEKMSFLKSIPIIQRYPPKKCASLKEYAASCWDCIKSSETGDTIVCWYDFMAVICWWMCRICREKRQIIALNILLKDKKTIKNRLAKVLYKYALDSKMVKATVTSPLYGKQVEKMLGIRKDFFLLHDLYHENYAIDYKGPVMPDSVFCGGNNGRDWELLFDIANALPLVRFNCVMPGHLMEQYASRIKNNIAVFTDVSENKFLELLCQSALVVMPLNTEAPAGLIACFQAAANNKMVITTSTVTTKEYFSCGKGVLCTRKIEDWKDAIQYFLLHPQEADSRAASCKEFLEIECSEKKYAEMLLEILNF